MMGPCHLQQACSLAKEKGLILGDDIPRVLFLWLRNWKGNEEWKILQERESHSPVSPSSLLLIQSSWKTVRGTTRVMMWRLCRVQKVCKRMNKVKTWLLWKDSSLRHRGERSKVSLATCMERLSMSFLGNPPSHLVVSTITRQTLKSTCSM